MKALLKWGRRVAIAVLLLLLLTAVGVGWLAKRFVTREGVVAAVEDELNARVEVGDLKIRTFGIPARVVVRDFKLGPGDEWVGRPLADRPPMEKAPVSVGEVRIAVELGGLLHRRIEVKELAFVAPRIEMTLLEDGGNSLEPLFRSPKAKKKKTRTRSESGALNVHEVGMLARLEGVAIRQGSATVTIEKSGLVVGISDWRMELDEIEVDPEALETMNTARLDLAGTVTLDAVQDFRYGVLSLSGPAEALLFDPETGDFAPDVRADLRLADDSYLTARIPVVHEAWRKVQKLANLGLDLGGFPERSTFGRAKSVALHYADSRLTVEKPLSMWFGDWEFALLDGAWLNPAETTHEASGELVASERMSALLGQQLEKALDYVPGEIRPATVQAIEDLWFQDGRLVARLGSEGDLSDPEVEVLNTYPDLTEILKDAGEEYAKEKLQDLGGSVLQKLLGDDED